MAQKMKKIKYDGTKGSIFEITPGKKYYLRVPLGKGKDGKYRRHNETFAGTLTQAKARIAKIIAEQEVFDDIEAIGGDLDELATYGLTREVIITMKMSASETMREFDERKAERAHIEELERVPTFAEWCEQYLNTRETMGERRSNTYKADRAYSKHLVRGLGEMRLTDIKPSTITTMYADMKSSGVGATTINQAHKLLKRIMHAALIDERISRNPVDHVEAPKKPKAKRESLTMEQAAKIRDITSSGTPTANETAIFLGLSLGARVGEVLGLEWRHIVLDGRHPNAYIVQQYLGDGETGPLKTDDDENPIGRRVPLDSSTVSLLKAWKAQQRKNLSVLGIIQDEGTPVITNEVGGFSDRRNFSSWFRTWCVKHGFGRWVSDDGTQIVELTAGVDDPALHPDCVIEWRDEEGWPCDENGKRYSRSHKRPARVKRHYDGLVYHELRHTHFTMRLASGTSIPVAQALGGWSTPAMLTEVYLHSMPEGIWDEAGFMDEVLSTRTA